MSEMKLPQRETPAGNAVFTQAELERMLESIGHWWHRHGYEEQEELEAYIRRLYESIPADLREGLGGDSIQVFVRSLYGLMDLTLGPVFGHAELTAELERFQKELKLKGAQEEDNMLTVKRGVFLETFDEFFDLEEMSQDLADQVQQVKDYLVR